MYTLLVCIIWRPRILLVLCLNCHWRNTVQLKCNCWKGSRNMAPRIAWQLYCLYVVHITHSSTLSPSHSLSLPLTHSLTHSVTHSLTHSFIHSLIHSSTHSLTHSLTHLLTFSLISLIHSLTHSLSFSLIHSLIHSFTHSLTHSFIHSLTHSLTHSPTHLYPPDILFFSHYFLFYIQLPRNSRMMYVHSYQSYIWNKMASERLRGLGLQPAVGDIVLAGGWKGTSKGKPDPDYLSTS